MAFDARNYLFGHPNKAAQRLNQAIRQPPSNPVENFSMREITGLRITAQESPATQGGVDSRQQIAFSMGFIDVTPGTKSNCFFHEDRRRLLAQKDDLRFWS
jgi:hypothetical protein